MEKLIHRSLRAMCGLLLSLACGSSMAAPLSKVDSLTTVIHFRLGKSRIDTLYQDNRQTLLHFKSFIDSIGTDAVRRISVQSWASPEGISPLNSKLVEERAESTCRLITGLYPQLAGRLTVERMGEAWAGLRLLVEKNDRLDRNENREILSVMDDDLLTTEQKKIRLALLPCYKSLTSKYYVWLRNSVIRTFYEAKQDVDEKQSAMDSPADTLCTPTEKVGADVPSPVQENENAGAEPDVAFAEKMPEDGQNGRGGLIGIKTNMLYDAVLVPNIGIEIPLGRHGSLSADWMYAWWRNNNRHRYWRVYGGELEGRYWLRKNEKGKLPSGHHVGLYAQVLTFDVEWGGRGYMGGTPGGTLWNKAMVGGGLSYGYSLSVARRLCIDFSAGIGYIGGQYQEYVPDDDCYVWQRTSRLHYFGPTRAEVSLVWWIPYGKNWKGGMR